MILPVRIRAHDVGHQFAARRLASSLFSTSSTSNWIADTITAIQNQQNEGGLLGMLDNAGGDGSINSFLSPKREYRERPRDDLTNQRHQRGQPVRADRGDKSAAGATPKSCRIRWINCPRSSRWCSRKTRSIPLSIFRTARRIDTTNNILTMPDGTQYDTTTGANTSIPTSIMQIGRRRLSQHQDQYPHAWPTAPRSTR